MRKRALAAASAVANAFRRRVGRPSGRPPEEVFFRRMFDQSPVGLAVLGPEQEILRTNPALRAMLGYRDGLPPGRKLWDLVHPEDVKAAMAKFRRFLGGETDVLHFEARCATNGGAWIWTHITTTVIRDDEGAALQFICILEDITPQIRMQANLVRSNADLALYASVAAHDLQEPVRKIITYGQILAGMSAQLPADGQAVLAKIQGAAARMKQLIEDLLDYSRVSTEALPLARVDLNLILSEVLSDLEVPIAGSRAKVTVAKLPEIEANALQIRLLFQNLISNAVKFVKPGKAPEIEVSSRLAGPDLVRIEVKDHGIGFDPQFSGRLFKPFQRLCDRSVYEGSGIGLAICRAVVERHGGSITAAGALDRGACFSFTLPIRRRKR